MSSQSMKYSIAFCMEYICTCAKYYGPWELMPGRVKKLDFLYLGAYFRAGLFHDIRYVDC